MMAVQDPLNRHPAQTLFGINFDRDRLDQIADVIGRGPVPGQGVRLVVTANVDHIVQLRRNAALRTAYRNSWRRTIDGMPVLLYARLRGIDVPERVTGADLLPPVMERLKPGDHRVFFVVANDDIGNRLVAWLVKRGFDPTTVDFAVPPFGFELREQYSAILCERVCTLRTTHLFFGVGCPQSETWIDRHRDSIGDLYALAVGAALSFFVGVEQRAPHLLRNIGFEWLWRVILEPKRLGPRYFLRSWSFLAAIVADLRNREAKQ